VTTLSRSRSPLSVLALCLVLAGSALLALACGPAEEADPTATPDAPVEVSEYTIDQFMENTSLRGLSFSPDGSKILVSTDETGVFNAYALPVDGGEPVQLTESTTDPVFVVSYMNDGESILYSSDQGGNELNHLYLLGPDGEVRDLTPGEELKAGFYGWARDRESFFVGSNERDARYFDVYEYDADTLERKLLFQDDEGLGFGGVSPDRRYIAFGKPYSTSDSDVFLVDLTTGEKKNLTEHDGFQQNDPMGFTPDGESLLIRTDEGSEFAYVESYDLESGETETLVEAEWDVAGADYSENGKYLAVWVNNDARTEIRVYEADGMEAVTLPDLPKAEITDLAFSRDESKISFYGSTARSPRDLYVATVGGGEARQLTDTLNPDIEAAHLVEPEVVRFASYDDVEVPGLLYKPRAASEENKVPALVWIHGGPGGQSRIGYSEVIQYLVNNGYAVYAINNRGSSGYGKTFFRMDDKKHGEADLDDVVASKRMLIDTGWIDPQRIGVAGGSYGGYLTLAALTFRPTEFAVGVDLFGISNWVRTMESIPPWWESFRLALYEEMGDPSTDAERLRRISPLFHADRIERPMMVLQGANDPRVLKVESDEIVEAVKANGVPVEYVLFDDEGHGFSSKENRKEAWTRILAFLDQHLAGEGGAAAEEAAEAERPAA
jgi:dipeptidyl aminopeptidase/acylaminoacyl peptidase